MFQLFDEVRQQSHALTGLIKEIGRSEECDIALVDDASLSRVHARLERDGAVWVLLDMGSTNGTFVNGERVQEARLQEGDVIEVGDSRLRFLPLAVGAQPLRKKTTQVNAQRSKPDPTVPDVSRGLFSRVKTTLKKQ